MTSRIGPLWARRTTLRLLVTRDLRIKYADSVLGYLWSVLDPLLMACVYWFVFTKIFHRNVGAEPYIVFLLTGLLPWNWANGVLNDSAKALSGEAKLVRSTGLDREIWVLRIVASKFMEFVFSLPVVGLFAVLYWGQVHLTPYVFALPIAVLLEAVLLTGVGLVLAPVTVLLPDVSRLVRIATRVLFYLSPVIYGFSNIPERAQPLVALNPLCGILELYRASFFPGQFAGWEPVATAATISVLTLMLGSWVFTRLEGPVLKEI